VTVGYQPDDAAIVLASDDNYARSIAVVLRSLFSHTSAELCPSVWILDDGISGDSKRRLERVAARAGRSRSLSWIPVPNERLADIGGAGHISRTSYVRFLIPELLPDNVRRTIYLDTDVLVRTDLRPLFEIDLEGKAIGAVRDLAFATVPHPYFGDSMPDYFNSGVMVLDMEAWKSEDLANRALARAAAQDPPFPFLDQDAMNALEVDWCELPDKWNVQVGFLFRPAFSDRFGGFRDELARDAAVLHYTGGLKPWYPDSRQPRTMTWIRTLLASGWYSPREAFQWAAPWLLKRGLLLSFGQSLLTTRNRVRSLLRSA